jgi:hypothetical protein
MKSFKSFLAESYENDKKFRDMAQKAYSKLMQYVATTDPYDLIEYKPEKGVVIFGQQIGYDNLLIIINPGNRKSGGFTEDGIKLSGKTYKVIMVQGTRQIFSKLNKELFKNTYIDRGTFVHEFIHYLDSERGDNYENSVEKMLKGGDKAYYNTSTEFNAYFQEISTFVENVLETAYRVDAEKVLVKWLKSFKAFDKTIKSVLKQDATLNGYITLLNKKYKRKYTKRLYNLYVALHKKYRK